MLEHRRIADLRRRFTRLLLLLGVGLAPRGYPRLYLALGIVVFVGACLLFIGIAAAVTSGAPLTAIDIQVSAWLHAHGSPSLTRVMLTITYLHTPLGISIFALVFALYLGWMRRWRWLPALVLAVPGGMLLNAFLKQVFQRQRPVFEDPILTLTSYSFPSGHVMGATVLYGMLAVFAVLTLRSWAWRALTVLAAAIMVALVGLSRIYLGVHYLSDTLAAAAEGLAWLALCLAIVDILSRPRHWPPRDLE